jgi:nitrogen fixation protein NifZ
MMNRPMSVWSAVARVARGCTIRKTEAAGFDAGDLVRALGKVRNDGTYAHKDIGEVIVEEGDVGFVHERWSFLGDVYYTTEFGNRAVVVIMRGRELAKAS